MPIFLDVLPRLGLREAEAVVAQAKSLFAGAGKDIGASFGTGVQWKVGRVSLAPEIRYTRWGSHPNIGFKKNQADVLLGITF